MKIVILVFSLMLSTIALLSTFVSAPAYDILFVIGSALAALGLTGFIYLGRTAAKFRVYFYGFCILPLYVLLNILLRAVWGIRISDFLT
ncbi:hypothetical protein ACO0LD_30695 [Undibacterium sp. Ji83W]|uniref:hypothetical protein n=1 Tax=Undibacterium sp. Ji83W TaxID=3413043 RepID=UPI003BF335D5